MSTDLDDQLAAYGRWLERQSGTDLRAPEPGRIAPPSPVAARRSESAVERPADSARRRSRFD